MKVSGLLLLVLFGCLWSWCFCLSAKCKIKQQEWSNGTSISCDHQKLETIPDDISSNVVRLTARSNYIRNITYLPQLPQLEILDLGMNCMEWFSWTSLRALPALRHLILNRNKLWHLQLDIVIEQLPKLAILDIRFNKLTSFSQYELGWPQVSMAFIEGNPFLCDCDLLWLIDKMACLQDCERERLKARCWQSRAAYFLVPNRNRTFCHTPSQLNGLSLSDVSNKLTDCGPHKPTAKAAIISTEEPKPRLQNNDTAPIKRFRANIRLSPPQNESSVEGSRQKDSSTTIHPTPAIKKSSVYTTTTRHREDKPLISYIPFIVAGSFLALGLLAIIFLFFYFKIKMENKLCCNWRKEANTGLFGRLLNLDIVIEQLPRLEILDVRLNKLTSFSQYELGWPQVSMAFIEGNPFHCDCDLSWLIDKMACLQACEGETFKERCWQSRAAYFLFPNRNRTFCHTPSQLKRLPLSDVSNKLTDCGPHKPTAKAAMISTEEPKSHLQNNDTFPIKRFSANTRLSSPQKVSSVEGSRQNDSSTMLHVHPTQIIKKSSVYTTSMRKRKEDKPLVPYIPFIVAGSFLALGLLAIIFMFYYFKIKMENKLCCTWRKEADTGLFDCLLDFSSDLSLVIFLH
uniref:LRRCT domain-containing protein n=1 Tax=Branchiostoma floridae TaxID=7739 RepID=C3ZUT1_BRAFL|eukprot:XP_002587665.1 hypothetical protein BRAFLDRAFT_92704 [Branchiostoma floridae]